jgi:phosphoenolpyruvate carboxylase
MDWLAAESRQTYGALLHSEGFVTFFREATPIDVIEESRIGSRPARRSGQSALTDLRAIPWVFSWSQARFFLSGWYGVGSALERLLRERPGDFTQLSHHLQAWAPLHYALSNAATAVAAADVDTMREYASLVEDGALRDRLLNRIIDEFARTSAMLARIYGGPLADRRPNIEASLYMRREPLQVLHREGDPARAALLLPKLLLTVNAIAGGLGATG